MKKTSNRVRRGLVIYFVRSEFEAGRTTLKDMLRRNERRNLASFKEASVKGAYYRVKAERERSIIGFKGHRRVPVAARRATSVVADSHTQPTTSYKGPGQPKHRSIEEILDELKLAIEALTAEKQEIAQRLAAVHKASEPLVKK